jgi:alpha-L-rhamnosidase
MKPIHLLCEYRVDPIGIDIPRPRLFWRFVETRRGAVQSAYQIEVREGDKLVWDSGNVKSDRSIHIEYGGPALQSRQRLHWRVRVWDESGTQGEWSEPAHWEMGLFHRDDWSANWIGAALAGGPRTSSPAPLFRHSIHLESKPVAARLYSTAAGVYEFSVNDTRVGTDELSPGWTDYRKRIQYQTHDVTDLVQAGENKLGAILGDGWFCGNVMWLGRQLYGDRPWLFAQLEVRFEDGSTQTFVTDEHWTTAFGPILENDLLMGESWDARREPGPWLPVVAHAEAPWHCPGLKIVAQQGPPVKSTQELKPVGDPKKVEQWPAPDYIYDMGQNMVGRVRLKARAPAGTTVRLRYAEVLKPDGAIYTENLRSAKQTDYYTFRGDPDGEVFEPKFTFHGFRYVELKGLPGEPTADAITGVVLHSDIPTTGTFACSDELVNQLQSNIDWGQRGNFLDVPTDCPQRDERLGWTGDAQVFVRTAAFNRDVAGFFTKWQNDIADAQGPEGQIPPVCPAAEVVGPDGGPAWADAAVICPWTIYRCYGDLRLLEQHYDSMKAFVGFLESTHDGFIRCYPGYEGFRGFGDWLSINAETPNDLIGTAFLAHSSELLSKIAHELGKTEDETHFRSLFDNAKSAFNDRYVTPDGLLSPPTQTAYVLALHFDLLPEAARNAAVQQLVDDIGPRGWHLSAGFVGSSYVNPVLTKGGRTDAAYKLLFQKTWPSWLYPVTKGATTIWERWDGWTEEKGFQDPGMNSFNHYAYGAIGSWLYQSVAGIDLAEPGYKKILLSPQLGEGLDWANASLESIHGRIESSWRKTEGGFIWDVLVPANTSATAHIPKSDRPIGTDGLGPGIDEGKFVSLEVPSGRYRFTA